MYTSTKDILTAPSHKLHLSICCPKGFKQCRCHFQVLNVKAVLLCETARPQTNILVSLQTTQHGQRGVSFFLSADTFCNSTPAVWCRHVSVFWYDAGRRRLLLNFQRTREAPGYEMGAPQQLFGPSSIPRQGLVPVSITIQTSTSPLNWLQVLRFHNKHSCISSMRSVGGWRDLYNSQFNANCFP